MTNATVTSADPVMAPEQRDNLGRDTRRIPQFQRQRPSERLVVLTQGFSLVLPVMSDVVPNSVEPKVRLAASSVARIGRRGQPTIFLPGLLKQIEPGLVAEVQFHRQRFNIVWRESVEPFLGLLLFGQHLAEHGQRRSRIMFRDPPKPDCYISTRDWIGRFLRGGVWKSSPGRPVCKIPGARCFGDLEQPDCGVQPPI